MRGLVLTSHDNLDRWDEAIHRTQVFRGAGVSPAIFPISIQRKNAGETPARRLSGDSACLFRYGGQFPNHW